ncbi:MAG: M1 family metallopeptidase [candidate division Zixibacteria bacterium]|nr:M1 family metallopeptidase [candidate division Zixibacteria bacterium]MDH3935717.1 M1 family metallopeptidase [candidate division Zixibacteria bacterium]MDH4033491.1 M1 family metallopeptidase [candidate division Zixibacteria bacterium]
MYAADRLKTLLSAITITAILCLTPVLCNAEDSDIDWDKAPPSLIHQKLWEAKASSLLDRQFARKMSAASPDVNTQTNYDVLFYDVNIRINDTTEVVYGTVKMIAAAAIDGVTEVQVDFHSSMFIDSLKYPAGTLSYTRMGDVVTVTLDASRNTGEEFETVFYYHGHPTEGGFQGFSFDTRFTSKVISSLSEPYFARSWWPCKDRMDDKADSFDIAITVDTSLYVASNGTLDSTVAFGANAHTFYWSVGYPMVTYLFSLAISDYTVWTDEWVYNAGQDTMPLVHAVYPDRYTYSLTKYGITPYALTVLSGKYGQYPFVTEKYGHANFEWGGAMEHQTMSSMGGSDFGFSEPVVIHELAHQWFGDMITCRAWGHIWLNEGWASYAEADYFLEKDGWAAYHSYMNNMAYTGGGTIYVEDWDTTGVWGIFHGGLSYDKGSWVLHMLRGVLGDQLFYDGVDAYTNSEFRHAAATTEDFRDVFENSSGRELDWFFEDWIYGTYRPNYHFRYLEEVSDSGGYDLYLLVEQVQTTNPQVFRMPVDFFFDFASIPDDTVQLWPNERRNMFIYNLPTTTNNIQCDPSDWVLKYESHQPWQLHFVTPVDGLADGEQFFEYSGELRAIGGSNNLAYTLVGGSLPDGYSLNLDGSISGSTLDTGTFTFTARADDNFGSFFDELEYSLRVGPTPPIPGDIDLSFAEPDIADLVYLVDFMFTGGPEPPVMNIADVNASCQIDIADLVYLVDFMFTGGPDPLIGCVIGKVEWPGPLSGPNQ